MRRATKFVGGPRDGHTSVLVPPTANPPKVVDSHYLLAIVTAEEAVYEWQHQHAGHKRRPTEPCCEPVHAGCPMWKPGATA